MLIVLDHDETYTAAPGFWDAFIDNVKAAGHTIICCTLRFPGDMNDDIDENMGKHGIHVVYAGLCRDKWQALQEAGYNPENAIWIDDCPQYILMGPQ